MRTMRHAIIAAGVVGTASTGMLLTGAPTASAEPAPCGYYEVGVAFWNEKFYNHCGPESIELRVDAHTGPDRFRCVPPGATSLDDIDYRWGVLGASATGKPC